MDPTPSIPRKVFKPTQLIVLKRLIAHPNSNHSHHNNRLSIPFAMMGLLKALIKTQSMHTQVAFRARRKSLARTQVVLRGRRGAALGRNSICSDVRVEEKSKIA